MTEDEQKFWDAAFVAYTTAIVSDPEWGHLSDSAIHECALRADMMLAERRKRQKTSTSA